MAWQIYLQLPVNLEKPVLKQYRRLYHESKTGNCSISFRYRGRKVYRQKVDYNTNDFELVNSIRDTAKLFADKVSTLKTARRNFQNYFLWERRAKIILGSSPVLLARQIT